MSELVSLTYDGEVAIVTIDNPPVNALSPVVMQAIGASIERAGRDEGVKSVVLIGNGPRLTGGADIHEFEKVTSGQRERGEGWYALFKRVEDCPRPVICAIHGTTLGGGVERVRDHRLSLYKNTAKPKIAASNYSTAPTTSCPRCGRAASSGSIDTSSARNDAVALWGYKGFAGRLVFAQACVAPPVPFH